MKLVFDLVYLIPVCSSIVGIYTIYKIKKEIDEIHQDHTTIMKGHLGYIESVDIHSKRIESIENTLEKIALSLPYRGEGWQTPYIQAKLEREFKYHFYDDEEHDDDK